MFDFDVNNYLNGIKIKVFGIEYDDTLSLQLKCNKFDGDTIHKYNVYDYYVDTSGIYVIYKEANAPTNNPKTIPSTIKEAEASTTVPTTVLITHKETDMDTTIPSTI